MKVNWKLFQIIFPRYSRESDALRCSRDKAEQERDNLQIDNKRLQTTIYEIQQDLSVIRAQRDAEL